MRLTDYRQKRLANETLQDLLDDDEYETLNDDVIDAVYDGDSEGELEALYDLDVPNGFVWHHGEKT